MFPQKFSNDARERHTGHMAIQFLSQLSTKELVKLIKKMGIAGFVAPDNTNIYSKQYKDNRITSTTTYQTNAGCCSFTKDPNMFYLFPIHREELKNVGIEEQDLIRWIKYLNDLRVGFKYLYFGEQEGNEFTDKHWAKNYPSRFNSINSYFWVGVPKFEKGTNKNVPYLHWIYLRYLINALTSSNVISGTYHHAYYNIPRVTMYMIDVLGLKPWKAFMYTNVAGAWYSSYSMSFSDYRDPTYIPDPTVTSTQFKTIWKTATNNGGMNIMLCALNNENPALKGVKETFIGKHVSSLCWDFYNGGQIKELVAYLDSIYYPSKKKYTPKAKANVTKKTAAKAKGKIPRIISNR